MGSRFIMGDSFKNLWKNWSVPVGKAQIIVAFAASLGASGASFSQDSERGLTLSASATGTYSDNYLRLSDAKAAERPSLIPEEYSLATNAQLGWNQRIGRQHLSFNADAGYRFNKNNGYLDTESVSADAALNWKLGAKCSGAITASYNRSQGDFETLDDVLHNVVSRKDGAANAHCSFSSRLGFVFGGGVSGADNSDATRSINDVEEQLVSAGLRLSLRGDDHINLFASQLWRQYNNRFVLLNVTDQNKQLNLGVKIQKSFGPRITLDGHLGYSKLTNQNFSILNTSLLSGNANISYSIGGRHTATLGVRQEIDSNANIMASHMKVKGVSLNVSSKWGAKIHSEFSVSHNEREIALSPTVVPESEFSNAYDKTKMATASFGYDIGRLVTLRLSGRIADRSAAQDFFNYTEKAVIFGLNFRYR